MKVYKCDKCGKFYEETEDIRAVAVRFCNSGAERQYPRMSWNSVHDIPTMIEIDLCYECWKRFVEKISKYLK